MTRKDLFLFALWSAAALALIGRALLEPRWVLTNFGDLYTYHYPMRHLVASALRPGSCLWDPYIFCGLPLSGNSQAVLFYPGSLLSAFLPLALSLSWDYALHMLWGALGLFLLARRERLSSAAACLLASLFMFSPFVVYRIISGIPTLLACLSWVPWCWLALLSQRRGFLAAALALQFFSGHPQFLTVNVLAMAVWATLRGDRRTWLLRLAAEGVAALALARSNGSPPESSRGIRSVWIGRAPSRWATPSTPPPYGPGFGLTPGQSSRRHLGQRALGLLRDLRDLHRLGGLGRRRRGSAQGPLIGGRMAHRARLAVGLGRQ